MIKWDVELGDKVSAPAHSASDAVQGLAHHVEGLHEKMDGLKEAWEVFEGTLAAKVIEKAFESLVEVGKEFIDTAIESSDRVTHLTEVFGALAGGGEEAGSAIFGMVRQLADQLPQSEKTVQEWARSLMAAGVTDMTRLQNSLRAVAGAESLVEGGGERVRGLLAKLNEASIKGTKIKFSIASLASTGLTEEDVMKQLGMTPKAFEMAKKAGELTGTQIADAVTKALGEKSAGPLAGQMSELSTIVAKGKDAFVRLFEGVDVKPLTDGIKSFFSVFDLANPSGQAIKEGIGGAMNFVFRVAGDVFEFLRKAFLHLMIWGLEAAIFVKPIIRSFTEWFDKVHGVQILFTALKGLAIVLGSIAAAAGIVLVVGGAVVSMFSAAALGIVTFIAYIIGLVPKAGEALGDLAFHAVEAATNFVQGLVNGIKNGVGLVVDAVKNMGKAAWTSIKNVLGIASPSKVMLDVGMHTSEGFAQGLEQGTDRVQDAAGSMARDAVPDRRSIGGASSSTSTSTSSVQNTFHIDVQINAGQAVTVEQHRSIVEEEFGSLASRLAAMMGTAPVPA